MKKAVRIVYALLWVGLLTPTGLRAEESAPFAISGFVDTYYSYNFNNPLSMKNGPGTNFDFDHNTFSLGLAELVVSKAAAPVGFRMDLDYGPTTDFVHCGSINCEPLASTETTFKNIQQAYVTWETPVGVTLDMGKFVTHMGLEVIESKDNWNYTRGLLFCCAIPYYHAGVRANYVINDMLFINGYVYNGWNNVVETNDSKTFGAQIGITPIKQLPIILNWIGPESSAGLFKDRQVYDAIATFNATDALSFAVNGDYGKQEDADPTSATFGDDLTWKGVAVYARYAITEASAVAIRYETADDKDGFMFGTPDNKVSEYTVTAEHKVGGALLTRLEYRADMSDKKIYEDKDGLTTKDTQSRIVLSAVYSF